MLPNLVHIDQVGFVKNRCSADNLRRILHIMWKSRNNIDPIVAFSLDAEKAFDKVELAFLFHTLESFGFGPSFRQWLQLVYTEPMATVLTNGVMSPLFKLSRGTRQGSPLSPLIFALFLEPLAIALRESKDIKGVQMGKEEHKLFLFADDILLITSNPDTAVSKISSIIDLFSEISGYTINWTKSEAMPISKICPPAMRESWQYKWMPAGLTYLGIKLTPGLDKIMQSNISPVIQALQPLLQNWAKLNISLLGRINLVKMIISPKIQYIVYMLPLHFPPGLLKLYNTVVESYIWTGKRPTFNRSKLYAAKENGGLSLSKIEWYQYAFSLSQLTKINNSQEQLPSWVRIEEELVAPTSLEAFLTQRGRPVPFKDPVLIFVQETWMTAHQLIKSSPYLTPKSSIWYNKKILIGKKPVMWEKWAKAGINLLCDLLSENGLMSFDEIKQKYNLRQEEFWKFIQIGHCIKTTRGRNPDPVTRIQELVHVTRQKKYGASKFYELFREAHSPHLEGLRLCWEKDVDEQIPADRWMKLVASWHNCSREAQSQLIQYKLLNRSQWTPSKMAKLKLRDSDKCWRCQKEVGTLVHMLYSCEKNVQLWEGVVTLLNDLFRMQLSKTPALCILGLLPDNNTLTVRQRLWVRLATTTGCRIILRHWKSTNPCCFKEWIELMTRMATFERVTYRVMGREDIFNKVWGSFLMSIERMSI